MCVFAHRTSYPSLRLQPFLKIKVTLTLRKVHLCHKKSSLISVFRNVFFCTSRTCPQAFKNFLNYYGNFSMT